MNLDKYIFHKEIKLQNILETKYRIVDYLLQFQHSIFLDNNSHLKHSRPEFEFLGAISFSSQKHYFHSNNFQDSFYFGHILYDDKNKFLNLSSNNLDNLYWSESGCYEADLIFISKNLKTLEVYSKSEIDLKFLSNQFSLPELSISKEYNWKNRFPKDEYVLAINELKQQIKEGDLYELNICIEQYLEKIDLDIFSTFYILNENNKAPFTALYRENENYVLCASPERYIAKKENQLISQPIKGTVKKSEDADEDFMNKLNLSSNEKERAENVMIVDLIRNDFAKISKAGSIRVDELMEIYTFKKVHHLISTISGELINDATVYEIIKATFPMGSMTGAPKKIACEYIEEREKSQRGLFSGSIGYISPEGDFDFNVVIRSLLYNATNKYVSLHTGSAITYLSDPEKEWEECILKASSVKSTLIEKN